MARYQHHLRIQRHLMRLNERERLVDPHNPLEVMTEREVFSRFRFYKESLHYLVDLIGEQIIHKNQRGNPLPVTLQVLITLRYVASNSFYGVVGDTMKPSISTSACWNAVHRCTRILAGIADRFIHLLPEDCYGLHEDFHAIAKFPKTIGAIDGTQIQILRPSVDDYFVYRNRHNVYALNVQVVGSPKFLILDINVDWPGTAHDNRIFRESGIHARLEAKELNGHLVGDSGYTLRRFCLTPFLTTVGDHQAAYDEAQMKTRVVVEQLFGVWKRRFSVLKTEIRVRTPVKASNIIWACAALHNIGLMRGDIVVGERELDEINEEIARNAHGEEDEEPEETAEGDAARYRKWFAAKYFGGSQEDIDAALAGLR